METRERLVPTSSRIHPAQHCGPVADRRAGPRRAAPLRRSMSRLFLTLGLLLLVLGGAVAPAQAADPVQDAISGALAWLHTQQLADGGFSAFGATSGVATTADAVYVLALLGEDPAGPAWTVNGHSALAALEMLSAAGPVPYPTRGAGEAGKILRAVALGGGDPRYFAGLDLVVEVEKHYDPATGRYHPDYLFRHTLAVEGLVRAGQLVPAPAYDALVAAQLPDGGWFWSFDATAADVDTTGRVLQLLSGRAGLACARVSERAASYLDAAQLASAGWGVNPAPDPNPANANSTALAVAGLRAAGFDPDGPRFQTGGKGGLQALLAFQEAGGAFRYMLPPDSPEVRLMATLETLMALAQQQATRPACRPIYLPLVIRTG